MKRESVYLAIIFVALAAMARLIKHPDNFSPVGSMALFGGAVFVSKYMKYFVPVVALYLSDFFLNNTVHRIWYPDHEGLIFFADYMIWSYISFVGAVFIGHFFIKKLTIGKVLAGAIGFTALFFIVSNFGVWASTTFYPKSITGLLACYVAGIPFLKSSLAGNLVYCAILFGGYVWINDLLQRYIASQSVKVKH